MAHHSKLSLAVSRRAGTPSGQTSPRWFAGIYFLSFSKFCSLRALTATQPVCKGMAHRPTGPQAISGEVDLLHLGWRQQMVLAVGARWLVRDVLALGLPGH